jgi:hypothetical protein
LAEAFADLPAGIVNYMDFALLFTAAHLRLFGNRNGLRQACQKD